MKEKLYSVRANSALAAVTGNAGSPAAKASSTAAGKGCLTRMPVSAGKCERLPAADDAASSAQPENDAGPETQPASTTLGYHRVQPQLRPTYLLDYLRQRGYRLLRNSRWLSYDEAREIIEQVQAGGDPVHMLEAMKAAGCIMIHYAGQCPTPSSWRPCRTE